MVSHGSKKPFRYHLRSGEALASESVFQILQHDLRLLAWLPILQQWLFIFESVFYRDHLLAELTNINGLSYERTGQCFLVMLIGISREYLHIGHDLDLGRGTTTRTIVPKAAMKEAHWQFMVTCSSTVQLAHGNGSHLRLLYRQSWLKLVRQAASCTFSLVVVQV